jgi:hypothetical protein
MVRAAVLLAGVLLAGPLLAAAPGVPALLPASPGRPAEAAFQPTRPLPVTPEQALALVEREMADLGVDHVDGERGEVASRWRRAQVGPNTYRTRAVAVVTRRAEGTVVSVKAQREVLMEALTPGAFRPVERWGTAGSDARLAADLVARIEKAAGLEETSPPAAGGEAPVLPLPSAAWEEIGRLKEERASLLQPVRRLDEQALEILYSGALDERREELDRIRGERQRLWESAMPRLMEIDRRILELVLEE